MRNKNKSWTVLAVAAIVLLSYFIYLYNSTERFNWRMTLDAESEEPYGTLIAKNIFQQYFGVTNFTTLDKKISESLPDSAVHNSNYIFIGEALLLDTADIEALLNFVEVGNTAFFSSVTIPDILMEEVFYHPVCDTLYWEDYTVYRDTALLTNFVHPNLKEKKPFSFPLLYNYRIQDAYWAGLMDHIFCDSANYPTIITQTPDSVANMVLFPFGEGNIYLHTTPITFTNYYLSQVKGQRYTEKILTHLPKGKVYWDGFSHVSESIARSKNWANHDPLKPRQGPLDYILSQPSLAWAWYLLLSLALLYLLFRAKRRQRVIPVLAENRNTSLAFISTIGRLHFSGQNHRRMALQKMDLMKSFIRSKYRLSTRETDEAFIKNLSIASEIDHSLLQKIFLIYTNIQSSTFVTDKTLIELHKLIHYFYKNCR